MSVRRVPFLTFREMRLARRMLISEAASELGVTEEVLIEYECDGGKIPCGVAVKLCRLYGIPSMDFIIVEGKETTI